MPPAAYITTKLVALSKDNAANWVKGEVKASEKGLNGKKDQWKVLLRECRQVNFRVAASSNSEIR
jgi:hypothetical protein